MFGKRKRLFVASASATEASKSEQQPIAASAADVGLASSSGDKSASALKTFSSSIDPLTAEPYTASRLPAAVAVDEEGDDDDDGDEDDDDDDGGGVSSGAAVGGGGRDNRAVLDKWFSDRFLCDPRAVAHPSP